MSQDESFLQDTGMVTLAVDIPRGSTIVFFANSNRLVVLAPATEQYFPRAELVVCQPFVVPILSDHGGLA